MDKLLNQLAETSLTEWMAVCASLIYVALVALNKVACWYFAGISSLLYIAITFGVNLYIESLLHVFYLIMAIVGFYSWSRPQQTKPVIITWPLRWHLFNIVGSLALALLLGFLFDTYTKQASPYLDATTTVFSLVATFMVTKRVIENWTYWIIIDALSIYLYSQRGLALSSLLMGIYCILAFYGLWKWKIKLKKQQHYASQLRVLSQLEKQH